MSTAGAPWRSRPVFISSTFRDMHAERDHLRDVVFPELEERLRQRHHYLEPIDLRVGVETGPLAGQQARELQVLKVCLDEIERSRPFLLVLVGDRYGWVPPAERIEAAAREAGFGTTAQGTSVTALEIEYGILKKDAAQRRRSLFYFREPLPYEQMGAFAAEYSDAHATDPAVRAGAARLETLKRKIGADPELQGRVHMYRLEWDAAARELRGIEAWGQRVLEDLWRELDEETSDFVCTAPSDWQEQERGALQEFVAGRLRGFSGREATLTRLLQIIRSPVAENATWGACVTGEPGLGKSALFARLVRELSVPADAVAVMPAPLLLAHAAGSAPRAAQLDALLRRWVEELAAELQVPSPLEEKAPTDDVVKAFSSLLHRVSAKRRVVVLLDALDQFEPTPRSRYVTWLPRPWPANARIVATSLPGSTADALSQRAGVERVALPALDLREAGEIGQAVWRRYHRECNPDVMANVLALRRADGLPAYANPLWLSLAMEQLNLIGADDFDRGGADMTRLLVEKASQLPSDIEGLYAAMLERAEKVYGQAWARAFAGMVAISRAGWRESDLQMLVPRAAALMSPSSAPPSWDPLAFATLRRGLRAQLAQRGSHGRWDFTHAQMRAGIERRYLGDQGLVRRLHAVVADHLLGLGQDDPLCTSEAMHHLIGADDRARAAGFYAEVKDAGEATRALVRLVTATVEAAEDAGLTWTAGLLDQAGSVPATAAALCSRFVFELDEALVNEARLSVRLELAVAAGRAAGRLAAADPDNASGQRVLSVSHEKAGNVLAAQGDLAGALQAYRAGLEIAQHRTVADPHNANWWQDLAVSHDRVGNALAAQGDFSGALRAYQACLKIAEPMAAADPDNASWRRDLCVAHYKVGDVVTAMGNRAAASLAYRESLRIAEALAAAELGNAILQRDLSICHERVGCVLTAQGDLAGALLAYRTSVEIRERLAAADPGNAIAQRDIAISQHRIGDVLTAQGDLAGALLAYRASLEIAERLAAADPGNADWQRDLAIGQHNIGDVFAARGDPAGALLAYRASQEIAERLVAAHPGTAGGQRDLAFIHGDLGDVLAAQGDRAGALRAYRASLQIGEGPAAANPANLIWQRDLSVGHAKVGDVLLAQGDLAGALQAYRASLQIREHLASADPGNSDWQRDLSVGHESVGEVLVAQGDLVGAMQAYRASLQIREHLAADDPANLIWQRDLSVGHEKVGDVLTAQGDISGALQAHRASLQVRERLAAADPANSVSQRDLSVSHSKMGDVLTAQGDLAGALQAYRADLQISERLAAAEPGNAGWQRDLAVSHEKVGDVFIAAGDLAGALQAYRTSLQIREPLAGADPGNAAWQRDLAVSHNRIGDVLAAQDDLAGALQAYGADLQITERLAAAHPENTGGQRDLAVSHLRIGEALTAQGDLASALQAYRANLRIAERLAAVDAGNEVWQRDLWVACCKVADTLEKQDDDSHVEWWLRARETLISMKKRGLHLLEQDESVLQWLNERAGG